MNTLIETVMRLGCEGCVNTRFISTNLPAMALLGSMDTTGVPLKITESIELELVIDVKKPVMKPKETVVPIILENSYTPHNEVCAPDSCIFGERITIVEQAINERIQLESNRGA